MFSQNKINFISADQARAPKWPMRSKIADNLNRIRRSGEVLADPINPQPSQENSQPSQESSQPNQANLKRIQGNPQPSQTNPQPSQANQQSSSATTAQPGTASLDTIRYANLLEGNVRPVMPEFLIIPRPSQVNRYRKQMLQPFLSDYPVGDFPAYCRNRLYKNVPVECRSTAINMFFSNNYRWNEPGVVI
jgi:hypothetical protein